MFFYYVVSQLDPECFYRGDGRTVNTTLNYVERKIVTVMNGHGELHSKELRCSDPVSVNGVWMVESIDEAMTTLQRHGVYPFESLSAAKEFSRYQNLEDVLYIAVRDFKGIYL